MLQVKLLSNFQNMAGKLVYRSGEKIKKSRGTILSLLVRRQLEIDLFSTSVLNDGKNWQSLMIRASVIHKVGPTIDNM